MQLSFDLKPEAALEFWRGKVQLSPSQFRELSREAKIRAFAVSGIAKGDELTTVFQALTKALEAGTPFAEFQRDCAAIFEARGWTGKRAWRIDNIFRTNIQTAYNVGRYQQMQRVKDKRPFWRYSAVNDRRTRPAHRAMHGKIFPAGHEFWDTWFPPNGFRCRCSVDSVGPDEMEANGWQVETKDPTGKLYEPTDPVTGVRLPARLAMPDPGWDFHVGKAGGVALGPALAEKATLWPAPIGARVFAELGQAGEEAIRTQYSTWLKSVREAPGARDSVATLGVMAAEDLSFLEGKGKRLATAAVTIEDRLVIGKKASRHQDAGDGLTAPEWDDLPTAVFRPEAVLYDNDDGKLLYVMPSQTDPRKVKIVVEPGALRKREPEANPARTVFKVGKDALMDRRRYTVIRGKIE